MVVLNAALLSLLLPAAVLARPNQHEKLHHKRHNHAEQHNAALTEVHPCGIHGGPASLCQPSGAESSAPYPTGNQTQPAPTGTGTGVESSVPATVTISSVITVVPVPVSSGGENGGTPTGGAGGSGGQGGPGGSGGPGGPGSPAESGSPSGNDVCGPATVTVTAAKTVTVTVPGSGAEQSQPPAPPVENKKPVEAKVQKPEHETTPKPVTHENKPAPEANAAPVEQTKPAPKTEQQHPAPQPEQAKPHPVEAAVKPPTEAKHVQPAPQVHKQQPAVHPQPEAKPASQPESKPASKPKTTPKKTSSGGKKGILYQNIENAQAMSGEASWGCNWDSSPIPAAGHASGSLNGMMFVPQLWGPQDVHTSIWAGNSQGAEYVMAFNEPNQPQGAGGCGPMDANSAVAPYEQNFKANKAAGQKIISPCVSNDAHEWLDTFIGATNLKPDAVCFHWYGMSLQELQGVVSTFASLQSKYGIPELWMTEWALNSDIPTSDATELLHWLENESGVDRFAYNNQKLETTPQMKQAYCGSS